MEYEGNIYRRQDYESEHCKQDYQYSSNQGIGESDPVGMVLCLMLVILFSGIFLLIGVASSNALFCHFMGVRNDGQYILRILGVWGVAIPSIIYIWYRIDTQSDSK